MSFSKRQGIDVVCYTKPLDSLKGWNDYFFWINAFVCPALFSWHTGKSVSRDVIPMSYEFSLEHYATLVTYPAPFHKCLFCAEIDLMSFIRTVDPTKVGIGERPRDEDEPKLLETTVGRVVPLLPVALDRFSGELVASVDKLFDEGGSGEQAKQGDSASGGHASKKRKTKVVDAGEPSHPDKKLRDDYGALGGPTVGGKSQSSIQRLLAGAVQNTEVRVRVMTTLPFVSSSVSTTPEHSSDHSGVNIAEAEVDSVVRTSMPIITSATITTPTAIAKEKLVGSFVFGADSPFIGGSHPIPGGFSDCIGSDFLIGGIHTMSLRAEVPMRAEYNIRERRRLDSIVEERDALLKAKDEEVGSLKAQLVLKEAEAAEAIRLRAEASNFEAVEKSLQSEVTALKERNNLLETEKIRLDAKVVDLAASVKVREQEVADLVAVVTFVKLQNDNLVDQVHKLETSSAGLQEKVTVYENCLSQLEKFQDDRMREMNDKFDKLDTDHVEIALHLEERARHFQVLGKAVEKSMQDRLSVGITHGAEGKVLTDVVAYNLYAEADYLAALQHSLAEKLGLTESQPHVDQLMVPIEHSPNQRVVGASALSLSFDVSSSMVRRIKENIAKHRLALCDVFVPLSEPLSITALMGTKSTLNVIPSTVDTTMALSVTLVSASLIPPISIDDYEVAYAKGGDSACADVNPFPNVDDAELNIP
nr:hypothetical protein [Tanacetum cinerariifolium]